jgi:hypothetical protein
VEETILGRIFRLLNPDTLHFASSTESAEEGEFVGGVEAAAGGETLG